jgi:hypothetical protein
MFIVNGRHSKQRIVGDIIMGLKVSSKALAALELAEGAIERMLEFDVPCWVGGQLPSWFALCIGNLVINGLPNMVDIISIYRLSAGE